MAVHGGEQSAELRQVLGVHETVSARDVSQTIAR